MRKLLAPALASALLAAPATATLMDDEPANDAIGPASIQLVRGGNVFAEAAIFLLTPNDLDFVGIEGLLPGDVLTAVTTPLADDTRPFALPDTVLGVFDASGLLLAVNDQAEGDGSLIRFRVTEPGTYFVGVTGFALPGTDPFPTSHAQTGGYGLGLFVVPAPIPEPSTGLLTLSGLGILLAVHRSAARRAPG